MQTLADEIQSKLSKIFGFKKSTFNAPDTDSSTGTFEQEVLFIEINNSRFRCRAGIETAQITGTLVVYSQPEKMPMGHFHKRIEQAEYALKKNFFFFDIDLNQDNSPSKIQNITERRVRFVYLHQAQYDPNHGQLTGLEVT